MESRGLELGVEGVGIGRWNRGVGVEGMESGGWGR